MGEGDASFDEWFRSAWPRLVLAVTLATGDRERAEDAVSEALVKVHDRWSSGVIEDPDAWGYRVAVRQAGRWWRRGRRMVPEAVGEPFVELVHRDHDLWAAVAGLPARQREAVVLRYVVDLTQRQVAEAMDVTEGTVATLLHRARATLEAQEDLR